MYAQDESLQLAPVADNVLDVLPSLGSISIGGSVAAQNGVDNAEFEVRQKFRDPEDAAQVCVLLSKHRIFTLVSRSACSPPTRLRVPESTS